uniref:Uncharacterized protein n=1 Tax=Nelumbo nucifera TaxID=4432 RepID=A0A822YUM0_NELNU|nr:TPA_asm: hypothetical protein HUJ06_005901 [Nelumbo nucifera]
MIFFRNKQNMLNEPVKDRRMEEPALEMQIKRREAQWDRTA